MLSDKLILFPPAVRGEGEGRKLPPPQRIPLGLPVKISIIQARGRGGGGRIIASEQALVVHSSGGASPSPLPTPPPVPPILAKAVQEWQMSG